MQASESVLRRSEHLSAFAHLGELYLYHDLYGYILKMSPDILAFLAEFEHPAEVAEVCQRHAGAFDGQSPQEFVDTFIQFACLVPLDEDEIDAIWCMVPVKSRWNVWRRDSDGSVTFYTAWGEREAKRVALTRDQTEVWDALDGERRLSEFRDRNDSALILDLIPRLVHHDMQALKLSAFPMSTYKGRHNLRPPYLTSTMPYAPYPLDSRGDSGTVRKNGETSDAAQPLTASANQVDEQGRMSRHGMPRGVPTERSGWAAGDSISSQADTTAKPGKYISTTGYYREQIADAEAQFDHRETTLSHLFRVPHPALQGRTYGQALVDALSARQLLPAAGSVRVLEIGAGLGFVARDVHTRLIEKGLEVGYEIVELSPTLARVQRQRLAELGVSIREEDVLQAELGSAFDLILANEIISDLPAVELTRAEVGADLAPQKRTAVLAVLGEVGQLISELGLNLDDAPERFYLNSGTIELMRRAWRALAPGGVCLLTEFGELAMYPRLSTQLDHPELSIHFGHMQTAARAIGFEVGFEYIIDFLDFDRSMRGMATTRSYFRALSWMLRESGIELKKIGYTESMFDQLIADKLSRADIGELHFDRIEDRLMGLVPHEFKALILKRPAH
ncbi:MAG: SAM-dependent methyltransferase [Proteobacteria bacterium]|nr:SAM-dependent methyltransferase [Pseudomonadota bacterium]